MLPKKISRWLAIYLLIAGLLVACNDNSTPAPTGGDKNPVAPVAGGSQNGSSEPLSGVSPGAAQPVELALADPASRVFSYAGLQFKVTKGAIITQPAASNPADAQLNLVLSVTNPTKETIRVAGGLLQIKLGSGLVLKQPLELTLQARDTRPYELNFTVPLDTKWAGAQLQLDEDGKEPALIALDGPVTAATYPVWLTAGGEVQVKNPKITYKITQASLDLDAQGERVAKGKRFLVLSVTATNRDPQNEALVSDDNFRVVAGDKPQAPDKIDPPAEGVRGSGKQDFSLAFAIPVSAQKATLQVGEVGKSTASIELNLSATATKNSPVAPGPASASDSAAPPATVKATSAPSQTTAAPTSAAASDTGAAAGTDACALFSQEDFKTVFGKAAGEPDQENFSQWTSCEYQFSDPALQGDSIAYGLEIRVLKGDFDRQKFESTYEVLQGQVQKVDGLGDAAYLKPSAQNVSATTLFVLKGKTSFTLSVLEPSSVGESQKETEVKVAAQKILQHL